MSLFYVHLIAILDSYFEFHAQAGTLSLHSSGVVNPNVERVEMLIVFVWRGRCNLLTLLRTSMIHLYSIFLGHFV